MWAEAGTVFVRHGEYLEAMPVLGFGYSQISRDASLVAAGAWRLYRARGGQRQRVVADFLIGAHAFQQGDRLLTRDRGFYRDYFESLVVIDPTDDDSR